MFQLKEIALQNPSPAQSSHPIKTIVIVNKTGEIHIGIEIPLFNFGKGNIRFLQLRAKKINLETKAMENFELDMDEAYFPEGVGIITYKTAIQTFMDQTKGTQLVITSDNIPAELLKELI